MTVSVCGTWIIKTTHNTTAATATATSSTGTASTTTTIDEMNVSTGASINMQLMMIGL